MNKSIRHGDVHLIPCDLPKDAKKINNSKKIVLAEGETTGHKHVLTLNRELEIYEAEGVRYVVVPIGEPALLTHEEHAPIEVPTGTYKQGQEIEFDPFEEELKKVLD